MDSKFSNGKFGNRHDSSVDSGEFAPQWRRYTEKWYKSLSCYAVSIKTVKLFFLSLKKESKAEISSIGWGFESDYVRYKN